MGKTFKRYVKCLIGFFVHRIPYFKKIRKYGLAVFVYHEVSDMPSDFSLQYNLAVSNKAFSFQIDFIKKHFNVVHPDQIDIGSEMPENAALVTFDDGMVTSFKNGLRILREKQIPSLFFLNMEPVEKGSPMIPAEISYLSMLGNDFTQFCKEKRLDSPYYLTITPSLLKSFFKKNEDTRELQCILKYQGEFASLKNLHEFADRSLVVFANHLYQHWNSEALTNDEFKNQLIQNKKSLSRFNNVINYFSFPNGQPITCFSDRHIDILSNYGVTKAFFSSGGINVNREKFLLDRISLTEDDNCDSLIWFRIFKKELMRILKFEM